MITLPTAYLAPEEWYRLWCKHWGRRRLACGSALGEEVGCQIEVMESFPKQTYRNRCTITTPDGPLTLTVPVKHSERKQLTRDVEISYQKHWQHQHWIALVSAYKRTPYFDYYMDYFRPFYEKETKFLLDLNEGLHEVIQTLIENRLPLVAETAGETPTSPVSLQHTTDWQAQDLESCFGNGMSILDKLMEYGPETIMKIGNKNEQ
ncbi:MAG: WbqC family protein [Paludibacteraceae bacterium]|nr:WbqC family protein [Paludibacteraceae bacterium]